MGNDEIYRIIVESLEAGKSGVFDVFNEFHSPRYTRFSDLPPYRLQERDEGLKLKISLLTQLVDFEYEIDDFRVVQLKDTALALFTLRYKGMAVNDYAFEGRLVSGTARCTCVLEKTSEGWRILHEHFSRMPEGFSTD